MQKSLFISANGRGPCGGMSCRPLLLLFKNKSSLIATQTRGNMSLARFMCRQIDMQGGSRMKMGLRVWIVNSSGRKVTKAIRFQTR